MGRRIGVVAGAGRLVGPALGELRRRGLIPIVVGIRGEAAPQIKSYGEVMAWLRPGELRKAVGFFKSHEIGELLFLGKIRPQTVFSRENFDTKTWRSLSELKEKNPAAVVAAAISYLEAQGLRVLSPQANLGFLFCEEGTLTKKRPSPALLRDIDLGLRVARQMADAEVGQSVAVKDGMVIAVEALEGTDEMIRRAGRLAGPGFVAVKAGRSRQDRRVDLPAVGLDTVKALVRAGGSGLGFEARGVAFFQKEEAVKLAAASGRTIVARKM